MTNNIKIKYEIYMEDKEYTIDNLGSYVEAQLQFIQIRDEMELGSSKLSKADVYSGNKKIGEISYNGKYWPENPEYDGEHYDVPTKLDVIRTIFDNALNKTILEGKYTPDDEHHFWNDVHANMYLDGLKDTYCQFVRPNENLTDEEREFITKEFTEVLDGGAEMGNSYFDQLADGYLNDLSYNRAMENAPSM